MIERYWSRKPGNIVNKETGEQLLGATFPGTIREWYDTLIEVMIDITIEAIKANNGKPLANCNWFVDSSIKPLIECSVMYKPLKDGTQPQIGMIGADQPGILYNVPVRADPLLYGNKVIELRQTLFNHCEGVHQNNTLGKIQLLGFD